MWIVRRQHGGKVSTYRTGSAIVAWFVMIVWRFTKPGIVSIERDPYY